MMHLMQPRHERPMRMPEHPVDDVFEERPRKQPSHKNKNECDADHTMILGPRHPLSNAAT
jgi:hypothetical protein